MVVRYLIQKTPIGTMMKANAEGNWVASEDFDRILAERNALQSRLNSVEGENDRLLQEAKSLVIQLHAAYGNTEHHEDCQRELLELEKNS